MNQFPQKEGVSVMKKRPGNTAGKFLERTPVDGGELVCHAKDAILIIKGPRNGNRQTGKRPRLRNCGLNRRGNFRFAGIGATWHQR